MREILPKRLEPRDDRAELAGDPPPAGPHEATALTDNDKTPGTGMLPLQDDANPAPSS